MPRYAYVNGRYLPHHRASVHIEDRGYQLADGVYEVVPLYRGRLIDEEPHLDRFDYSLRELRIQPPMSRAALKLVLRELVRRNGLSDGALYFQATRGVAPREHKFPAKSKTALVATLRRARPPSEQQIEAGVPVVAIPDIRWQRCDIKAIGLLPNLLGKQQAVEAGAFEAWQIDSTGNVTEGTTTNAWIVTADGALVTRDAGQAILSGITRKSVLALVAAAGMRLEERPFSLAEAHAAREAFITSSSAFVLPVASIDGRKVGDGRPGPIAKRLRALFIARALENPAGMSGAGMSRIRFDRPRAILFDWDNTLVDNWAVIRAALNAALAAMGQAPWSLAETKARVRASLRDSFPRMFGERWRDAEKIFYDRFAETHLAELREMPGAGRLLGELAAAGFTLGVVSNKRGGYLRAEAAHLGWAGHFHRLVGSGDARADKPAPEPVRLALEGVGLAPGPGVWFVGDADIDLVCAAASGCLPVLLREAPPEAGEFASHPPALHLKTCAELAEFIEKL